MNKINNIYFFFALSGIFLVSCGDSSQLQEQNASEEQQVEVLDTTTYLKNGGDIAQATFKVLSQNLQQAMAEGGVENALKFCNVNAMPLTDSLSKHFNVEIKRTSHKVRNINNAPSAEEQQVIDQYLSQGKELKPVVQKNEKGSVSFYAPIITKGLCVTCHGQVGTTIAEKDYQTIQSLYPEDKATGFNVDELRGIWSITFNN